MSEVLQIVKACSSGLHGIFLKHGALSADFQYPFLNELCPAKKSHDEDRRAQQETACLRQNVSMVKKACEEEGIIFEATIYDNPCLDEFIAQSASAELLLLDASINLKEYFISSIHVCLKDIFTSLCCPVKFFNSMTFSQTE